MLKPDKTAQMTKEKNNLKWHLRKIEDKPTLVLDNEFSSEERYVGNLYIEIDGYSLDGVEGSFKEISVMLDHEIISQGDHKYTKMKAKEYSLLLTKSIRLHERKMERCHLALIKMTTGLPQVSCSLWNVSHT